MSTYPTKEIKMDIDGVNNYINTFNKNIDELSTKMQSILKSVEDFATNCMVTETATAFNVAVQGINKKFNEYVSKAKSEAELLSLFAADLKAEDQRIVSVLKPNVNIKF